MIDLIYGRRSASADVRLASRYIPEGAMAINHPDGLGVAYVQQMPIPGDKWAAVGYRGTAGKSSFNYSFRSRESCEKFVSDWLQSLTEHAQRVEEWRKDASKPTTLKAGDIITNSWGYDQTNVDWYRVTRATAHFAWLKRIAADVEETGFMSGPSAPHVDTASNDPAEWGFKDIDGPEVKHKASGDSVTMRYGSGSKWDGRPRYCSWYA